MQLKENDIQLYDFGNTKEKDAADSDHDEVLNEEDHPPFAVVSSNTFTDTLILVLISWILHPRILSKR